VDEDMPDRARNTGGRTVSQLKRLSIPASLAEIYADRIDWHQIARLVKNGCPPQLALRIVR